MENSEGAALSNAINIDFCKVYTLYYPNVHLKHNFSSRLVTQDVNFKQGCVYAVLLSIGTPIGIVLGVAVEAQLTGTKLLIVTAVIQVMLYTK